jgi:hypothetical protein
MDAHNDGGEEVAYVDMAEDAEGMCACGMHNANIGIALVIRFQKKQLPWFANWQHWAKGEYVTGLEPATNPPIGQARAREQNQLIFLQPGESRHYNIEFEILTGTEEIHNFISSNESE